jgi:hypothetical protein
MHRAPARRRRAHRRRVAAGAVEQGRDGGSARRHGCPAVLAGQTDRPAEQQVHLRLLHVCVEAVLRGVPAAAAGPVRGLR